MSSDDRPILLVGDDPAVLRQIEAELSHVGHPILASVDPSQTPELIKSRRPALIILDIASTSDGLALLDRIRPMTPVSIIMISGEDKAETAVQALRHGAYDYLLRPVDIRKLLNIVLVVLGTESDPYNLRRIARYELRREIGRGGMGVVYEARDRTLDRLVAVKVLQPEYAADPHFELRFLAEARAAARLSHPGLVPVFEAGRHRGQLYIAMELVEGQTLQAMRESGHTFKTAEALSIGARVAEALDAAHSAGLVHGDIKPANLMHTQRQIIKVLDFGLVRPIRSGSVPMKELVSPLATPAYAAPETLRGERPTPRSDIYSLGVVLYELLLNDYVFAGSTVSQIVHNVLEGRVQYPLSLAPSEARLLVEWMISVKPEERPVSMKEVLAHLLRTRAAIT
jgi:CheY-like chemotaxis protein